jgi:hypothetical protein
MIPKGGHRFSEEIMLQLTIRARWRFEEKPSRSSALVHASTSAVLAILLLGLGAGWTHGQSSPTFVPRDERPEDFAPGPGRDEAFYACTACHNFRLVAAQGLSRERWDDTLTFMTARHNMPALAGDERRLVLDYLETAYPPRAPASRGGWQSPFAPR